jgi:beta-lactamase superfamily II metal-dependent hydrolase
MMRRAQTMPQRRRAVANPRSLVALVLAALAICQADAAPGASELRIYAIDVEGGQATLFVTPAHESLLVDTGWAGDGARDAERIARVARDAGVSWLDYVVITHYHADHVGGFPELAARIPIGSAIDHGDYGNTDDDVTEHGWLAYKNALAGGIRRLTLHAGDRIPLRDIPTTVVSSAGAQIPDRLPGTSDAPNPNCADSVRYPADTSENALSLGFIMTWGNVRILDLGDLTSDRERNLVCPQNKLGRIDLLIVSHHGSAESNSPLLLRSIAPRVAVMDNGASKGGAPAVIDTLRSAPGLEALWQIHLSEEGGAAHNAAPEYIANLSGVDAANYLMVSVNRDGSMTVFNSRTRGSKRYAARGGRLASHSRESERPTEFVHGKIGAVDRREQGGHSAAGWSQAQGRWVAVRRSWTASQVCA